jgi:hypothetical protein
MTSIQHYEGTSYLWETADMRMVSDDFGTLQIVPYCWGPWMQASFEAY